MPTWRSGYRVSLENLFPQGFAGSNPAVGVYLLKRSLQDSPNFSKHLNNLFPHIKQKEAKNGSKERFSNFCGDSFDTITIMAT
jgi:hypothetical protein